MRSRLFAGSGGGRLLFLRLHGPRGHDAILPRVGDELSKVFVRVGYEDVNNVAIVSLRAELWQRLCEICVAKPVVQIGWSPTLPLLLSH